MIKKIIIITEKTYDSSKYWSIVGISSNIVKMWFIPISLEKFTRKGFIEIFYFLFTANQVKVIDKTNCFWNILYITLVCNINFCNSKAYKKKWVKFKNSMLYNMNDTNLEDLLPKFSHTKISNLWCLIKNIQNFNFFKNQFVGTQFFKTTTCRDSLKREFRFFFESTHPLDKKVYEDLRKIFSGGDNMLCRPTSINPSFYDINSHYAYCMLGLIPTTLFSFLKVHKNLHITNTLGFCSFLVKSTKYRLTMPTTLLKLLLKCGLKIKVISIFAFNKKYIFKNHLFWYFYIRFIQNTKLMYQTYYKSSLVLLYGWTGLKYNYTDKNIMSCIYIPVTIVSQATLYLNIFKNKNNNTFVYTDTDSFLLDKPLNNVFQHNSIGGLKTKKSKLLFKYIFAQKFYFTLAINNSVFTYQYAVKSFRFNFKKSLPYQFFDNTGGFSLINCIVPKTKLSTISFQLSGFCIVTSPFFRNSFFFKKI